MHSVSPRAVSHTDQISRKEFMAAMKRKASGVFDPESTKIDEPAESAKIDEPAEST